MRRRRQRNPLLMRIVVISIAAHLIALPVLAHFGAFKRIQQHFVEITAIKLPPPPPPERSEVKKQEKPKPQRIAQKAKAKAGGESHRHIGPSHPSAPTPHIATAAGGAGGGQGDFTAPEGSGKAGELPKVDSGPKPQPPAAPKPTPPPTEPPHIEKAKPTEIARAPEPKPEPVKPMPAPAPKPHLPVFTEAEPAVPTDQEPKPEIPDDLRQEALDKTFTAEVTVSPDGTPTEVKVSQSTGNDELDRIALETAKKWKFKPGTRDGEPVESVVRLHIEFQVS